MASPPFNPATTTPQDNDLVSQYPLAERTFRDIMNSWLLINHDNNGQHPKITMTQIATPATPAANIIVIFQSTTGTLGYIDSSGTVFQLGVPTGTILEFAGASAPNGYLLCFGQAVSRTTYANLFAVISTTYGIGDGSTTFNLPDLRGRVMAGVDNMGGSAAGRIGSVSTDNGTIVGTTQGSTGGSSTHQQTSGELIAHSHNNTLSDPGHTHLFDWQNVGVQGGGTNVANLNANGNSKPTQSSTTGITINNATTGGSAAMAWLQPTIMMNMMIKI